MSERILKVVLYLTDPLLAESDDVLGRALVTIVRAEQEVASDGYGDCTRTQQVTTDSKGDPMVDDKRKDETPDPVRKNPRDGDNDGRTNEGDDRDTGKQPIGPGGSPMDPSKK